ncbi:hypothetical protein STRIP9103_02674 [Streptomyces ipomoeae 91-03]|uniref:Uncharacterized protein n=1 Tax=Streptomyces ipomoeae 91-03 TaxID=698759 RepID=L1KMF3_9ACTN|nr:hypothetical protein STRIP9103_02674 [Streptomyces ipomoeae 91-03]
MGDPAPVPVPVEPVPVPVEPVGSVAPAVEEPVFTSSVIPLNSPSHDAW